MSTASPTAPPDAGVRLRWGAFFVGVVALGGCAAAAPTGPAPFFRAYLAAYLWVLGITLGSLAILMMYHLTGGAWGYLIRHPLESAVRTLPLVAVLFVPIGLGAEYLYPWARPGGLAGEEVKPTQPPSAAPSFTNPDVKPDEGMRNKRLYLNVPFFWARAAVYFLLWGGFGYFLEAWSRRQEHGGDPGLIARFERLSGAGLVFYGITMLFASTDWLLSLEPAFRSTIFGPLFASGHLLTAFAFALIVLARTATRPAVADAVSPSILNDLGNILFTFVIIWAYMVFFQFMLLWIANLPHEVLYYLPRERGGWFWVAMALIAFGLLLPFFLLLMRPVKRNLTTLAAVAGLVLFMQLVFLYYEVMPAFPNTPVEEHWMDFLTPLGLGGLWLGFFLWQYERRPAFVANDPNREAAASLRRADLEEAALEKEVDDD